MRKFRIITSILLILALAFFCLGCGNETPAAAANSANAKEAVPVIHVDMYASLALSVLILFLGKLLRKKIGFLVTCCIPAPVAGGFIFAIVSCILYVSGTAEFSIDETLKNVCMTVFFTTVGFQANLKELRRGGKTLIIYLAAIFILIILQDLTAVFLGSALGVGKGIGLCTGSIPMVGGHGTAAAFGPILEKLNVENASTVCTTCATYGLIAGSVLGGPMAKILITKRDLLKTAVPTEYDAEESSGENIAEKYGSYGPAVYQTVLAMGIGVILSKLLSMTGATFPSYIGAMIAAAFIRNISELTGRYESPMKELSDIGNICLSLFLGVAMATLKLWQLKALALPLLALLLAQTILSYLFIRFVVFSVLGKDYDAAVICAGTCGFAMGATPNAMANMQAVTDRYLPSIKAYLIVPLVGGMFVDFFNSLVITFFVNLL